MESKIEACPKCGKNDFKVIETLVHRGEFYEGTLDVHSCMENSTDSVTCINCNFELPMEGIEIEYCG
jgi:predicted nucleic-acid-binding Zn-ribbon protein